MSITIKIADGVEVRTANLGGYEEGPDALEVVVAGEVMYTAEIACDALDEAKALARMVLAVYAHGFGARK
jgi:hypothetical protein